MPRTWIDKLLTSNTPPPAAPTVIESTVPGDLTRASNPYGVSGSPMSGAELAVEGSRLGGNMHVPQGTPDATLMRRWTTTNSVVYACVAYRKQEIANSRWDVVIDDHLHLSKAELARAEAARERLIRLLSRPSDQAKNNSFSGMVEQFVDDAIVLGVASLIPQYTKSGEPMQLHNFDAARVNFVPGWRSDKDGPRYTVRLDGFARPVPVMNKDLIIMVLNENTYSDTGTPPLRVLHDKLDAFYKTFLSAGQVQKNRNPATLVNLAGMSKKDIARLKALFENEIAGQSTVAWINFPVDQMKVQPLGDVNLRNQAADWFVDWMVREVTMTFRLTPTVLGWTHDVNLNTSSNQSKEAHDAGILPLMADVAGIINRDVSYLFHPNLRFVWPDLEEDDRIREVETLKKLAGPKDFTRTNDLRRLGGYEEFDYRQDDPELQQYVDYPSWQVGQGIFMPLPMAHQYIKALITSMQAPAPAVPGVGAPATVEEPPVSPEEDEVVDGRSGAEEVLTA